MELCYVCKDRSMSIYMGGVQDGYNDAMLAWIRELYEGRVIKCSCCGNSYEYVREGRGWTGNKIEEESEWKRL